MKNSPQASTAVLDATDASSAPGAAPIYLIVEHRSYSDIDGIPAHETRPLLSLGFFNDYADASARVEVLNTHLVAEYDRFVAQQHREHAAAIRTYERKMLERRVIIEAGLVPSSPEPLVPGSQPFVPSYEQFVERLQSTDQCVRYEIALVEQAQSGPSARG